MKTLIKIVIGGAVCFALSRALADTHYVNASNAAPAWPHLTWETAATTIHAAVNAADNGDTVLVADGTYNIVSEILVSKSLTVESLNGPNAVTVNANGNCRGFRIHAYYGPVTLKGFTVTGGYVDYDNSVGGGIVARGGGPVEISNCTVRNSEALLHGGGIHVGGGIGDHFNVLIRNCIVENNTAGNHGGGIHVPMWTGRTGTINIEDCIVNGNTCSGEGGGLRCISIDGFVTVSRCLIANNTAAKGGGVLLGHNCLIADSLVVGNRSTSSGGGGICQRFNNQSGDVVNCTVVGNQAAASGGGIHNQYIYNSIICQNTAPGRPDIGPYTTVSNSCSPDLTAGVAGNVCDDPQFIYPGGGDYRLLATSPCIDTGGNSWVCNATDITCCPRITDGDLDDLAVVDMGAYEFQILEVSIDIKPGSDTNPNNLKSKGRTPVAILTDDTFDALTVAPSTVRFADAAPVHMVPEDVDGDSDIDLLLHFPTSELQLSHTSAQAHLIAQTHAGEMIAGADAVTVVP